MPMIDLSTNVTISGMSRLELARGLGEAIALIPGKDEGRLMLRISGNNDMFFKGRDDIPMAYVHPGWKYLSDHPADSLLDHRWRIIWLKLRYAMIYNRISSCWSR